MVDGVVAGGALPCEELVASHVFVPHGGIGIVDRVYGQVTPAYGMHHAYMWRISCFFVRCCNTRFPVRGFILLFDETQLWALERDEILKQVLIRQAQYSRNIGNSGVDLNRNVAVGTRERNILQHRRSALAANHTS